MLRQLPLLSERAKQRTEELELTPSCFSGRCSIRAGTRIQLHEHGVDVVDVAGELGETLVPRLELGIVLVEMIQGTLQLDEAPDSKLVPMVIGVRALEMIERSLVLALII